VSVEALIASPPHPPRAAGAEAATAVRMHYRLPKARQRFVMRMIDTMLQQQQASR
jgi:hypothetical protein